MGATVATDFVVDVNNSDDIVTARQAGHELARQLGFSLTDVTMIATAISEIARNITSYAGRGEVRVGVQYRDGRQALVVRAPRTTALASSTLTRAGGRLFDRTWARPWPAWRATIDGPVGCGIVSRQRHDRRDVEMDSAPCVEVGGSDRSSGPRRVAPYPARRCAATFRSPSTSAAPPRYSVWRTDWVTARRPRPRRCAPTKS